VTGRNFSGDVVMAGGAQQAQTWRRELPFPDALAVIKIASEKFARVIVTLRDGTVCALRGSDGEPLWQNSEAGADSAAAVADVNGESLLFVAGKDGTIRALDPNTGETRARAQISGVAPRGPVVAVKDRDSALLLISCGERGIVAVDAATLRERWRSPVGQSISTAGVAGDLGGQSRSVVACTDSGNVLILNLETGALISKEPLAEGRRLVPYGAPSLLMSKDGKSAKFFITCSDKGAPIPPAAMLMTKTIRLSDQ
jgi:outer membrane protein assembly factor BamB